MVAYGADKRDRCMKEGEAALSLRIMVRAYLYAELLQTVHVRPHTRQGRRRSPRPPSLCSEAAEWLNCAYLSKFANCISRPRRPTCLPGIASAGNVRSQPRHCRRNLTWLRVSGVLSAAITLDVSGAFNFTTVVPCSHFLCVHARGIMIPGVNTTRHLLLASPVTHREVSVT